MICAIAAFALGLPTFHVDARSARNLAEVQPSLKQLAATFLRNARKTHPDVRVCVIEGYRSFEEQALDYAKGRTTDGPKVTWAPPGFSYHNFGYAFDVGVFRGKTYSQDPDDYEMLSDCAPDHLDWGGDFQAKKKDIPHYEEKVHSLKAMRRMHEKNEDIPDAPEWLSSETFTLQSASFQTPARKATDREAFRIGLTNLKDALLHGKPLYRRDLVALLPRSAHLSASKWEEDDQAVGNVSSVEGTIQGNIIFLNDAQREALTQGKDPDSTAYSPADAVAGVQIFLADTVKADAQTVRRRIEASIRKVLGLAPKSRLTIPQHDNAVNVNGECIRWHLKSGAELDLWQNWYGHRWTLCLWI